MLPYKNFFSVLILSCSLFLSLNSAFAMDSHPANFPVLDCYADKMHLNRWATLMESSKKDIEGEHRIVLFTNVLPDGLGDLVLCMQAYQTIKKKYPKAIIKVLITTGWERELLDLNVFGISEEDYLIVPAADAQGRPHFKSTMLEALCRGKSKPPVNAGATDQQLLEDFWNKALKFAIFVDEAQIRLEISTHSHKYFFLPDSAEKYGFFPEYGKTKITVVPPEVVFHMGVGTDSFGIFILKPTLKEQFTDPFLEELFKEEVYFNYGKDVQEYAALIRSLNDGLDEINIITNVALNKIADMKFPGFSKVIYLDKSRQETCVSLSDGSGATLRLINAFPIMKHDDMLLAINRSQEPVGVTGNNTFSEALSLKKLPFYNAVSATESFWKQLQAVAKFAFPDSALLHAYLEQLSYRTGGPKVKIDAAELATLKEQWLELVSFVIGNYDIEKALLGKVNIALEAK